MNEHSDRRRRHGWAEEHARITNATPANDEAGNIPLSGDTTSTQTGSLTVSPGPLMCPEASDEYQEINEKVANASVDLVGERHDVSTTHRVILRDGQPVLELRAWCTCGWSATTTLPDSADNDNEEEDN